MMLLSFGFDGHEPHGAMCFSRDTIWAGRFLRSFQRIEAIEVPIHRLRHGPIQGLARQNRAALLAAPLRRVFDAFYEWMLCFGSQSPDHQADDKRGTHVPLLSCGAHCPGRRLARSECPPNTQISSEGRHRECPDLVCCIWLFYDASLPNTRQGGHSNLQRRRQVRQPHPSVRSVAPCNRPRQAIAGARLQ